MKKKSFFLILTCLATSCAAIGLSSCSFFYNTNKDDFKFERIDGKDEYRVTKFNSTQETDIVIPSTFNDMPVTEIGENAFKDCNNLQNIEIPDSILSIGDSAFYNCSSLNEIIIPNSVTTIGSSAFSNCSGAYYIMIPESVTSIGSSAFSQCTNITYIEYRAIECASAGIYSSNFRNAGQNRSGIELFIGKDVKSIPDYLFSAPQIGTITTSANECPKIEYINFEEGSSCERIGDYAFHFAFYLDYLSLPNTIKYIGESAFYQAARLDEVTIPESTTFLGKDSFASCSNLENIYFNAIECKDSTSPSRAFTLAGINTDGCTITIGSKVKRVPAHISDMSGAAHDNITGVFFASNSQCESIGEKHFFAV